MENKNLRRAVLSTLAVSVSLSLTGCAAMLERSYEISQRHVNTPVTAEDASYVRVESYQELVSAVLYLVTQGEETGVIRLYDYNGEEEKDLARACLEVSSMDPLGAYAVDYIKHESTRVLSYYQATLSVRYRRTPEQVASIVRVTGSTAIRQKVQIALSTFEPEVVLRVAYFAEDEASLEALIRQAYRDNPATALGMPEFRISLYPSEGRDRILEIVFTYPEQVTTLRAQSGRLTARVEQLTSVLMNQDSHTAALQAATVLSETAVYDAARPDTAYAALVEGSAGGEGLAQAYILLCRDVGISCERLDGIRLGENWTWTAVQLESGETLYFDPVYSDGLLHTDQEMLQAGYDWPGAPMRIEPAVSTDLPETEAPETTTPETTAPETAVAETAHIIHSE